MRFHSGVHARTRRMTVALCVVASTAGTGCLRPAKCGNDGDCEPAVQLCAEDGRCQDRSEVLRLRASGGASSGNTSSTSGSSAVSGSSSTSASGTQSSSTAPPSSSGSASSAVGTSSSTSTTGPSSTSGPAASSSSSPASSAETVGVVMDIAVGSDFTCVVREDGALLCWGSNGGHRLGLNDFNEHRTATRVAGGATRVAAGADHACAILDGGLRCWGNNDKAQAAPPDAGGTVALPHYISLPPSGGAIRVSAGSSFTCALSTDFQLYCWGENSRGQVGAGTTDNPVLLPTPVPGRYKEVSLGGAQACAIDLDGGLSCWGRNAYGEGGNPDGGFPSLPTPVVGGVRDWTQLSAGSQHTCGIDGQHRLWCWGYNGCGELGMADAGIPGIPVQVPGQWTAVAAGGSSTCAIAESGGTLFCWGSNPGGLFVDAGPACVTSPVMFPSMVGGVQLRPASFIDVGPLHLCARGNDGLFCWGSNASGAIGDGTVEDRSVPTLIP